MPKSTVVIFAAAAFCLGTIPAQTTQADDDIWDLMNPAWWADEMFDDDDYDDDEWYYWDHPYSPYWGNPYGWHRPPVHVIVNEPETEAQNPETRLPE